jgi:hypothetical protein
MTGKQDDTSSLSQLRDITGIEVPPGPSAPQWPAWAVISLGVALCTAFLGWRVRRLRARASVPIAPEQWALTELDRIEALALPAAGEVERFHALVSDVVRRFFELRFGLRASMQTTPEFLATLRQAPQLSEAQGPVREFMERCDQAKFARAGFSAAECQALAEMARSMIQRQAST